MPNKKNGLKKNMGYMGGGTMMPTAPVSSMYRMGGKLYMGGGNTKTDNTMSYKDDVQKRFGGGGMTEPSMKKNKMAEGGKLKPTAGTGVQSKPVGTPTQVPNKSAMIAAAKAKANEASLATDRPARTSTPNTAGAAAARASITPNRGNFGGESRGGTGTKVVPKKKPVAKKKKLPSKRGGG
mgnify:FL=1